MKNQWPKLIVFALVMALVLIASPGLNRQASALSSGVVISQVYGGGGNSGAAIKSDFIELFNRGNSTVSLNGWFRSICRVYRHFLAENRFDECYLTAWPILSD